MIFTKILRSEMTIFLLHRGHMSCNKKKVTTTSNTILSDRERIFSNMGNYRQL